MGKYSSLRDGLTKLTAEPTHQDKVDMAKNEIKTKIFEMLGRKAQPMDLGNVLIAARIEKNRLEELIKEQSLVIAAMEQDLVEFLEAADLVSVRMGNGVSLSIKDDVYSQVSDKAAFHQWVRSNHLDDLFSVHYQTMNSMVKEKLMNGEEVPPGITPYFKQGIMVRGMKNLKGENDGQ